MAYTEFYCQNGGSNLNAGSTTNNTAAYTSTNGNWNGSTTFTPADTQSASLVSVGDFASVYLDGASVGVFVARVTTVNQSGGNITSIVVSAAAKAGSAPASGATGRTMKVGGAWLGPNGASGFPLSLTTWANLRDSSLHVCRFNLKNDQTYSISSQITNSVGGAGLVQGYSGSVNDGGKAVIDGSTNAIQLYNCSSNTSVILQDLIFASSATSGSATGIVIAAFNVLFRCVVHGIRGIGISSNGGHVIECEVYDFNKSNTASLGGIHATTGDGNMFWRNYIHDATQANAHGVVIPGGVGIVPIIAFNMFDTIGGNGIYVNSSVSAVGIRAFNNDFYNLSGSGIRFNAAASPGSFYSENSNFIQNTGYGIDGSGATTLCGWLFNSGYGTGTAQNASGNTNALDGIAESGSISYGTDLVPWTSPTTGDFRISNLAAYNAGRGAFTETDGTNTGTVGYPDIGAAMHLDTSETPVHRETSYGFSG